MDKINFDAKRQEYERGASVEGVLKDAFERNAEFDEVVVIALTKKNEIEFGYSIENTAKTIGVLEVVKTHFVEIISNEEVE